MNDVETSRATIAKVCPELMAYFESGTRASLLELGLLHAAARRAILRLNAAARRFEHVRC